MHANERACTLSCGGHLGESQDNPTFLLDYHLPLNWHPSLAHPILATSVIFIGVISRASEQKDFANKSFPARGTESGQIRPPTSGKSRIAKTRIIVQQSTKRDVSVGLVDCCSTIANDY